MPGLHLLASRCLAPEKQSQYPLNITMIKLISMISLYRKEVSAMSGVARQHHAEFRSSYIQSSSCRGVPGLIEVALTQF